MTKKYAMDNKKDEMSNGDTKNNDKNAVLTSGDKDKIHNYVNAAFVGSASELSNQGASTVTGDYYTSAEAKEDISIDNYDVEQQQRHNGGRRRRGNAVTQQVHRIQIGIGNFWTTYNNIIWIVIYVVLAGLYFAYFGYAMWYQFGDEGSVRLLVCTVLTVVFIASRLLLNSFNDQVDGCLDKVKTSWKKMNKKKRKRITNGCYYAFLVSFAVFAFVWVIVDIGINTPRNLISAAGLGCLVLFCFVFSHDPAGVRWRPVILGLYIQFAFALMILRWTFGFEAFSWLGDRVNELLAYTRNGSGFLFTDNLLSVFAFGVLPIIVFFSTLVSILYYLGVMQFIIRVIARGMAFLMGTSPAESLNAAANIFIGMTEAPLIFRSFLEFMTNSELHAIMTGGFATIAGSVLAAYISFGVPANHLLTASVMSAPAALAMSKLFYPESEKVTAGANLVYKMEKGTERNILEAAANGASASIKLIANIAVNLIAFISLLAFLNATLTWFGHRAGVDNPALTFELICSYVFWPLAFVMGVAPVDCFEVGKLIGIKTFINEFVAYIELSKYIKNQEILDNFKAGLSNVTLSDGELGMLPRSSAIATYALCGFANVGSIGIMIGALGSMAPTRRSDISSIVIRAMIAGNVACFMTACIAGLLME